MSDSALKLDERTDKLDEVVTVSIDQSKNESLGVRFRKKLSHAASDPAGGFARRQLRDQRLTRIIGKAPSEEER